MRLLMISDTHGHLTCIDRLAKQVHADAVIHAGDFGFYDEGSVERLGNRELFLRVVHSDLPSDVRKRAKKLTGDALRSFVRNDLPLSDLVEWKRTGQGFSLPTFAVWGNHEDGAVVADLLADRWHVPNLTLLGNASFGPFRFFGLGGNLLPELLGEEVSLEGGRGKMRATASQISKLLASVSPKTPSEVRVLVTHVSPGKVPLVSLLAAALEADITVSGHMGSPYGCVWDDFAVREPEEALARVTAASASLPADLKALLPPPSAEPPAKWYRGSFHINLPDAPDGHAVIQLDQGRLSLETFSAGVQLFSNDASNSTVAALP